MPVLFEFDSGLKMYCTLIKETSKCYVDSVYLKIKWHRLKVCWMRIACH